jgi:hypothetical protein
MQTIRLNVNESALQKLLHFLNGFSKDEVEILSVEQDFLSTQQYLQKELDEINSGHITFLSQTEFENRLNKII